MHKSSSMIKHVIFNKNIWVSNNKTYQMTVVMDLQKTLLNKLPIPDYKAYMESRTPRQIQFELVKDHRPNKGKLLSSRLQYIYQTPIYIN